VKSIDRPGVPLEAPAISQTAGTAGAPNGNQIGNALGHADATDGTLAGDILEATPQMTGPEMPRFMTDAATVLIVRDSTRGDRHTAIVLVGTTIFWPLTTFFGERNYGINTERGYARAVALLINFMVACGGEYEQLFSRKQFYKAFAHRLSFGTIDYQGHDLSGLWWRPRTAKNVSMLLGAACEFSDWLVENFDVEPLNGYRTASIHEQIIFWRRWNRHKGRALLAHTKDQSKAAVSASRARRHALPEKVPTYSGRPPFFPHNRFPELLVKGFLRPWVPDTAHIWQRYNIRDMMVAILLHAGGLRCSEAFHLWITDVYVDPFDPTMSVVRVFHPSDGDFSFPDPLTQRTVTTNRADYLATHFNRRPLHRELTTNGWKGNALQSPGNWMPVIWLPSFFGQIFLALFKLYINHVRPLYLPHPWLFVTKNGDPMSSKKYSKRHQNAAERIGLEVAKPLGTTPHGHRHAYAQLLQDLREAKLIDEKIFQIALHHKSAASQQAYNEKEIAHVTSTLNRAAQSLNLQSNFAEAVKEMFL